MAEMTNAGIRWRTMRRAGLWGAVIGLPLLLLATFIYRYYSPHLLLEPITRAALLANEHPSGWWRTVDVDLVPGLLAPGLDLLQVNARLEQAGFRLRNDDVMPQSYRLSELDEGYTHTFTRNGRGRLACGEILTIRVGMKDGALAKAAIRGVWTCL